MCEPWKEKSVLCGIELMSNTALNQMTLPALIGVALNPPVIVLGAPPDMGPVSMMLALYCQISPGSRRLLWLVSPVLNPPLKTGGGLKSSDVSPGVPALSTTVT